MDTFYTYLFSINVLVLYFFKGLDCLYRLSVRRSWAGELCRPPKLNCDQYYKQDQSLFRETTDKTAVFNQFNTIKRHSCETRIDVNALMQACT